MRLIDADYLKELFDPNTWQGDMLRTIIDKLPTAYDVDKVVEQMEELTELAYKRYMDTPSDNPCYARYSTQYSERKVFLDIVKGGGQG